MLYQETEAGGSLDDLEDLNRINQLAQTPLSRDQVYIRSMYLCSSQLCESDWCRFSDQALAQICQQVVGQSVLAGHDKQSLPVARFFKAVLVERPEVLDMETSLPTRWVRAWFYWLKETQGARDLALNMDGGIYREVSISWRYRGGRCSICGKAQHTCPHVSGEMYEGLRCYTWIDDILDVLEGSLVYRGADRKTGIAGEHHGAWLPRTDDLERMLLFEAGPVLEEEMKP
jgi:hypothetical protein